ncbi:MAG: GatB/YqeY domain-containing protein [Porticoccus sp.]|jgi:uncharacterized protein YqeY|uniref:GatB/YqeY domain-containing protein n=1 Tax=Porticoccus sp. Uisw_050_02 TaxID=3230978 RepID=UPI0030A182AF|tara:strand:- start:53 stop:493 length:441 start_codon:yes stop_codon:yes gene_type:complete
MLKAQITQEMKNAMRAKNKLKLGAIRLILSGIKQIEVDERIELDDVRILAVLDKMVKQRRDSVTQYVDANRQELADIELAEIVIIQEFLPEALSDSEVATMVSDAIAESGAQSMKDMGAIMAIIKPKIQGRADVGAVSTIIKAKLS